MFRLIDGGASSFFWKLHVGTRRGVAELQSQNKSNKEK